MGDSPTPDPSLGVFETLLVVGGEPVELDAHLGRLRSSLERLYGARLPDAAGDLIRRGVREIDLGRVRLSASPERTEIGLDVEAVAIDADIVFPPWDRGLDLITEVVRDWRGGHKWADRRFLDALDAAASPAGALLVDADGAVLETTRANVFVVRGDGELVTPPADGRILPGIARMRAIDVARAAGIETVEAEIAAAELASAREVFTTGSVRGVEPVRSIDGAPVGSAGASVADTIATGLRRHWIDDRRPVAEKTL